MEYITKPQLLTDSHKNIFQEAILLDLRKIQFHVKIVLLKSHVAHNEHYLMSNNSNMTLRISECEVQCTSHKLSQMQNSRCSKKFSFSVKYHSK